MSAQVANRPEPQTAARQGRVSANHVVLLLIATIVAGYFPTLYELHNKWTLFDQFYSHGYLLLAFSIYLGFELRHRLGAMPLRPLPWLLLPLGGTVLVWTLARIVDVQIVQFLLLPAILLLACAVTLGLRATRLVAGPACLIYFAIPLWDYAIPVLQSMTVAVCGALVSVLGIPVRLTGNYVEIPAGIFHVEQGCSGVNYLVVMLALAYSYAWLERLNRRQCAALVTLAALMGLATNWFRVGSLVVIGYETQMRHPLVHQHVTYGWMLFAVALVLLALIMRYVLPALALPAREAAVQPVVASHWRPGLQAWVVAVLLIGPLLAVLAQAKLGGGADLNAVQLPQGMAKDGWVFTQAGSAPRWQPDFHDADDVVVKKAGKGFDEWTLHIYRYRSQLHGKELIGYNNHLVAEAAWEQVDSGMLAPNLGYLDIRANSGGERYRVWYWYEVAGRETTSPLAAKLYSAAGILLGRSDASLVTLSRPCSSQCESIGNEIDSIRGLVTVVRGAF